MQYTILLSRRITVIFIRLHEVVYTDSDFQFLCNYITCKCANNSMSKVKRITKNALQ